MRATWITGLGWVTSTESATGRDATSFALHPGTIPKIIREQVFDRPMPRFGRMDDFSRLGLAAIGLALKDAKLDIITNQRPISIVAATTYGCLHTDLEYLDSLVVDASPSPSIFAYTLPNCFLGEAAIHYGLTGGSYVVNMPGDDGLYAIRMALDDISLGDGGPFLVGICDMGRPQRLNSDIDANSGAVFMTLQTCIEPPATAYGRISLGESDHVRFDGDRVNGIVELINGCLRSSAACKANGET